MAYTPKEAINQQMIDLQWAYMDLYSGHMDELFSDHMDFHYKSADLSALSSIRKASPVKRVETNLSGLA